MAEASAADDALVAQLVDMGFESEAAATALLITENDLSRALDWLAENSAPGLTESAFKPEPTSKKDQGSGKRGTDSNSGKPAKKPSHDNLKKDPKATPLSTPSKLKTSSTSNPVSPSSAYSPAFNPQYSPAFSPNYSPVPTSPNGISTFTTTAYSPSQITSLLSSPEPSRQVEELRPDSPEVVALLADITSLDQKFKGLYQKRIDLDKKRDDLRQALHPNLPPSPPQNSELYGSSSPRGSTKRPSLTNSQNQQHQVFNEKFQKLREMSKTSHDLPKLNNPSDALRSSLKQVERPPVDLTPTAPINEKEIKKIDAQFENHLKAHPHDASDILFGHFQMILCLPNHPVTQRSNFIEWSKTWFSPYARIETPSPAQVKSVSNLIPNRIQSLGDVIVGYYQFIKKKPELVEKISEAIFDIIWSYVYADFFSLVRKANAEEDHLYASAVMSLQAVSIESFDVRPQYHLANEGQPYLPAINLFKGIARACTSAEKLAILAATASKVVSCVVDYWKNQPIIEGQKRPETSVGGDELLPLMTYVMIKARLPNLFSECAFMEMLISDKQAIEQEGYVLATMQTALSLILAMSEERVKQEQEQAMQEQRVPQLSFDKPLEV